MPAPDPITPQSTVAELVAAIANTVRPGAWCSADKGQTLGAIVTAVRPRVVVEIGVWEGGSLIPMLLALKRNGTGDAFAIDPWSPSASVVGESVDNIAWWGQVNHEDAYQVFRHRLAQHGLESICHVQRMTSDDATVPELIDVIHLDGNHTEQAQRDIERYGARVTRGGILILDDMQWSGGAVTRAHDYAKRVLGFHELYPLGTGCVMMRRGVGS